MAETPQWRLVGDWFDVDRVRGVTTADRAGGFGFKWEWDGRSSKHFPFDWSGPDD